MMYGVWGSSRLPKFANFTSSSLLADFHVEIVLNSMHFQNGMLWICRLGNPEQYRLCRWFAEFYGMKKEKYCVANKVDQRPFASAE